MKGKTIVSFAPLLAVVTLLFSAAPASAQGAATQAPCSPVVDRTQGNVTVTFSGGCTVGVTPAELKDILDSVLARRPIPPEWQDRYDMLGRAFGVTDTALMNFFRILGQNKVATEDLDAKLREIGARHITLLKQAEPLADDDPQVAAIKNEAVAAISAGNYVRAKELLERAFDTDLAVARRAQDVANKRYLSAAKTRADLGELNSAELQYAAAAQDFQAAANLVPSGKLLVRSVYLNNLGSAALNAGNYPLAFTAFSEALSIREKMLGPEHPGVATSLNNLALLYKFQGQYAEAESLYKRTLAIREKVPGPEHPDTAASLSNLAALYHRQGRYTEAEPLLKRAIAIREKVPGPEHPDTAASVNDLANVYQSQGKYGESEGLYKRTLAIREQALGANHPLVATALGGLANVYQSQGKYAEAEPLFKRALAIYEKVLGPEHPNVATGLNNLASLYDNQSRYAEAEPFFKRALAIYEKVLGPEHPNVATGLNNLASLYDNQSRYAEAEPLFKRALAIDEKALGPEHPTTQSIHENLRSTQNNLTRSNRALPDAQR